MSLLSERIERKFVESFDVNDFEVWSEDGWVDIVSTNKTIEYQVIRIELENGMHLECADDHILIDVDYNEVFAKDSLGVILRTESGNSKVVSIEYSNEYENMYDLSVDSENHTYYTNGILSHNTTTVAGYILHYTLFEKRKTVAILANKASTAREILARIQLMYEFLPKWMQHGVKEWNKGSYELENGSKVFCAATSGSGIRGKSCVTGDTKVFIEYLGDVSSFSIKQVEFLFTPGMKILTPTGFQHFEGIVNNGVKSVFKIDFTDNTSIKTTEDHRFYWNGQWIELKDLHKGYVLSEKVIKSIDYYGEEEVFDAVNVENGNAYFTNGVISHNCNMLYLDEFGIVPNNIADEFFASVYPTISAGKSTKVVITSTPMGYNHFWKMWNEAEQGINGFVPVKANWYDHPHRDQKWADDQLRALGPVKYAQEVLCIGKDTLVTVKDINTDIVETITIEDLHIRLQLEDNHFEILAPTGFQDFDGVVKKQANTIKLIFEHNDIVITPDHRFVDNNIEIIAESLKVGDNLHGDIIKEIIDYGIQDVFDPVNVSNGNLYYSNSLVSHNCDFQGSSFTLISGNALSRLSPKKFIYESPDGLDILEKPVSGHSYVIVCDPSEGTSNDNHAFVIFDVTEYPFSVVGKFANNTLSTFVIPQILLKVAKEYNEAFILCEVNKAKEIPQILIDDYEYENVIGCKRHEKKGQVPTESAYGDKNLLGVMTDRKVKRIGCISLKSMIEEDKLLIHDTDIIGELSTFIEKGRSYEADSGAKDDLVMCCVLFAWLTTSDFFKDVSNKDTRGGLYQRYMEELERDMLPVGWFDDGTAGDHYQMGMPFGF